MDDLWALFYVLVDLALGGSPWRTHTVRRYAVHCCPCARALFTYMLPSPRCDAMISRRHSSSFVAVGVGCVWWPVCDRRTEINLSK